MGDEWKTWSFRQKVIHQLEELIRQIPPNQHRNAHDLELQVFQRSGKRDEYMQFIARVIMHLRDLAQNNNQQQNNNPHLQAVLSAPGPATQMTGPGGHITGTVTQMAGPSGPMSGPGGPGPGQMVATSGQVVTGPNTTILTEDVVMLEGDLEEQPFQDALDTVHVHSTISSELPAPEATTADRHPPTPYDTSAAAMPASTGYKDGRMPESTENLRFYRSPPLCSTVRHTISPPSPILPYDIQLPEQYLESLLALRNLQVSAL